MWTPASVTQSFFTYQRLTLYSDSSCTTVVGTPQTLNTYGLSSSTVNFPGDGTYYFKITTRMGTSTDIVSACVRRGIKIDATAPAAATALSWNGATASPSNAVKVNWTKSSSTEVASQSLFIYSGNSCDTLVQTISGMDASTQSKT